MSGTSIHLYAAAIIVALKAKLNAPAGLHNTHFAHSLRLEIEEVEAILSLIARSEAADGEVAHWKGLADEHALFDAETDLAFKDLDHQIADLTARNAELVAQRDRLVEALERLTRDHYDEGGVIDLTTAYLIVGRDSTNSLQLKGSFIARLEEARTALSATTPEQSA